MSRACEFSTRFLGTNKSHGSDARKKAHEKANCEGGGRGVGAREREIGGGAHYFHVPTAGSSIIGV